MIEELKKANPGYQTTELCRVFELNLSSYYFKPAVKDKSLDDRIISIFNDTLGTYGKRRVKVALSDEGITVGKFKIASIMKRLGLVAVRPMKRHYYPDAGTELAYAPNLLNRKFNPATLDTHWVGDITYIRTHQGWSYLACVLDLASKEIVGYALSKCANAQLAKRALLNAIARKQAATASLMFHSDQGCQYSAKLFRDCLASHKVTQSMSRRGNCWDNSVMERFFRNLKTERLNRLSFINHEAVVSVVGQYINFYNYKRKNSAIDYLAPHEKYTQLKNVA